jgi:hypothetical protein
MTPSEDQSEKAPTHVAVVLRLTRADFSSTFPREGFLSVKRATTKAPAASDGEMSKELEELKKNSTSA